MPYRNPPSRNEEATSGKYFKKLVRFSTSELKSHATARSSFAKAMEYPVKDLEERFAKVTLDGKPVEVHPWPRHEKVQAILDVLKSINSGMMRKLAFD